MLIAPVGILLMFYNLYLQRFNFLIISRWLNCIPEKIVNGELECGKSNKAYIRKISP